MAAEMIGEVVMMVLIAGCGPSSKDNGIFGETGGVSLRRRSPSAEVGGMLGIDRRRQ
jgi:hypothetical protein